MAKREPAVELFYDPAELNPDVPRLRIGKRAGCWEVRADGGALLSSNATLPDALDDAMDRARTCSSEIIVRGSSGRIEWAVSQNPELVELARWLNARIPSEPGAAA